VGAYRRYWRKECFIPSPEGLPLRNPEGLKVPAFRLCNTKAAPRRSEEQKASTKVAQYPAAARARQLKGWRGKRANGCLCITPIELYTENSNYQRVTNGSNPARQEA
jgi:hypothetical protein